MPETSLVIATRNSQLAMWQANWFKQLLAKRYPELSISLLPLTTSGDKAPYLSLATAGGKGLFVKELEEALLSGAADIAVHCLKDMPALLPPELTLAAICQREQANDVFISHRYSSVAALPIGAVVGTSSLRRRSQLLHLRPDLVVKGLRGNVNTRLTKLAGGDYEAIMLAYAGLKRLGMLERVTCVLNDNDFLPAAGQGALAIQCRVNDATTIKRIEPFNDLTTQQCTNAERAMCRHLSASCQTPVAAFATIVERQLHLRGVVGSVDGRQLLRAETKVHPDNAELAGQTVAQLLLDQGAKQILEAIS